jgi:hypothetical protein
MKGNMTEIANTFEKTLREVRAGMAMSELSEGLANLVQAVRASGKGGKLVLELKIKPASKGETVCVFIEDEITVKAPKPEKASSIFFTTEDNLLQRQDPRQMVMELREVPAPKQELKEVKNAVNQ